MHITRPRPSTNIGDTFVVNQVTAICSEALGGCADIGKVAETAFRQPKKIDGDQDGHQQDGPDGVQKPVGFPTKRRMPALIGHMADRFFDPF